jgi:hypothetical protein
MIRTFALSLVLLAGCLTHVGYAIHHDPWPCGRTYYGCQCGGLFWHEWFSHKPCCCDPCNQCGQFTASNNPYVVNGPRYTRFGEVYSDGSGSNRPGAIGELYNGPSTGEPTPAAPGPAPNEPAPEMLDEMGPTPAGPSGPTTMIPRSRVTASPRSADQRFESMPPSRTMGRPPRTRLFTR